VKGFKGPPNCIFNQTLLDMRILVNINIVVETDKGIPPPANTRIKLGWLNLRLSNIGVRRGILDIDVVR
jgi:hypothetical protein